MSGNDSKTTILIRFGFTAVLLALLIGLLLLAGTIDHATANGSYANEKEWMMDTDTYIDERVSVSGVVIGTDPVVIEVVHDQVQITSVTIENSDVDPKVGQEFGAFGTLTKAHTIDAERTHHRDRWETQYMYIISFLGGLVVLGRLLRHWRLDRSRRGYVPRSDDNA